jgi:hypothetical protein
LLLKGQVCFRNLSIGNPEGFKTDHAFQMDSILLEFVPRSLLSKRIMIRNINIDAPDIMYEQTLSGNNFGKIMENLKNTQTEKPAQDASRSGQKEETKVEIDKILISAGKIHVSMPGMGSAAAPIPLPTIQLADIGKDQRGASAEEVINQVFTAIFDGITRAVLSSGDIIGKGIEGIGDGAESAGKNAVEAAQAAGDTATDAGKKAVGAAREGIGAVKDLLGGK